MLDADILHELFSVELEAVLKCIIIDLTNAEKHFQNLLKCYIVSMLNALFQKTERTSEQEMQV